MLETPELLKAAAHAARERSEVGADAAADASADDGAPTVIEVNYGYSRDHRDDLKQWILALVTSGEVIPQILRPLDGNASDKRAVFAAVTALTQQLRESGETPGVYVADSGLYSAENISQLNAAGVWWVSRVPETSSATHASVHERLESSIETTQDTQDTQVREAGRAARTGHATGGASGSPICRKAPNAGSWSAPRKGKSAHVPRSSARRSEIRRPGRNGSGIWATRRLPASLTPRRRWPRRVSASRPDSPSPPR
jgi:hypothetical protein